MLRKTGFLLLVSLFICSMPAWCRLDRSFDGVHIKTYFQATLTISYAYKNGSRFIVVDPWSKANLPRELKADIILVTDIHFDHYDPDEIRRLLKKKTLVVVPPAVADKMRADLPQVKPIRLKNGESKQLSGITVKAVPMYNTSPERAQYHTKGRGNGYVLTIRNVRIYVAGDTQCIPEMKRLSNLTVAFLPINLPYTMDAKEAAQCVRQFKPAFIVPYHFDVGEANLQQFYTLVQDIPGVSLLRNDP